MSEDIKLSVNDEETIASDGERTICPLCLKNASKYTCPRCNLPYCSVECYRSDKHKDCSEGFYKDCFMEGLKDYESSPAERQKVLKMLKRAETDPELNDLDVSDDDLDQRLGDLDLDKDSQEVWSRLTDQEKKEFEAMVGDGRLGNLVELWTPWWTNSLPIVTDVESDVANSCLPPNILTDIPNISQLLKGKPSADVKYNVINLLFSYCYISRLHNGDQVSMATESANDIVTMSSVLGQGHTCGSVEEAIQLCMKSLMNKSSSFESSPEFNVSVIKDVEMIITRSGEIEPVKYLLAALSEVCQIFKMAHKHLVKKLKVEKSAAVKDKYKKYKSKLFQNLKKCEFYMSWAQTYGMALIGLVPELQVVYSLLSAELEDVNQSKKKLETEWGGKTKPRKKKLIEEV